MPKAPLKKKKLTLALLKSEAAIFAKEQSELDHPELYGVTDGKAVGTYMEHKFKEVLLWKYAFATGNSALGIDFPELDVDIKVTSIKQPQSSCPFKSARQKIYGLGYSLLVFVYDKIDNAESKTGRLKFMHTIFVERDQTADYQITTGIHKILENNANIEDLVAYMRDRNLPIDEIEMIKIAEELMKTKPNIGYLTISNALQWRLQYGRVIQEAGKVDGVTELYNANGKKK